VYRGHRDGMLNSVHLASGAWKGALRGSLQRGLWACARGCGRLLRGELCAAVPCASPLDARAAVACTSVWHVKTASSQTLGQGGGVGRGWGRVYQAGSW
jgi:hypothetical protein